MSACGVRAHTAAESDVSTTAGGNFGSTVRCHTHTRTHRRACIDTITHTNTQRHTREELWRKCARIFRGWVPSSHTHILNELGGATGCVFACMYVCVVCTPNLTTYARVRVCRQRVNSFITHWRVCRHTRKPHSSKCRHRHDAFIGRRSVPLSLSGRGLMGLCF